MGWVTGLKPLIRYKNEKDLTVLIKKAGDITPVMSFAAYLDFRRLFEGEIWVEISDASDLKAMLEANTYRNIHIRPFIDLTDKTFSVSEYLELFRVYPVGAFVLKNGRNNGELLSAIEAIAQNKSHSEFLLRRICI